MEKFADSYVKGETPVPCIDCNQTVKFRDLFKSAKNLNADALATGHYVKRVFNNNAKMYRPDDLKSRSKLFFIQYYSRTIRIFKISIRRIFQKF